jgi:hypothetical protein
VIEKSSFGFRQCKGFLQSDKNDQTGAGFDPVSNPMRSVGLFPRGKAAGT